MNRGSAIQWKWSAGFFVMNREAGLLFHSSNITIHCVFEPGLLEHDWMQSLRKSAHLNERGLRDIADLAEVRAEGRTLRRMFSGTIEQRTDGRENLTELVMQFTG